MLKKKYIDKLFTGKKTATIRLGEYIPKYNEVIIHSGGKPICIAKITRVTYKKIKDLTNEDAVKDGFSNLKALLSELKRIYGSFRPDEKVTIIEFKVIKDLRNLTLNNVYLGLKPSDIARLALRYLGSELYHEELMVIKKLAMGLSIREVAKELTGSPLKRTFIRKVLRKALKKLISKGLIGVGNNTRKALDRK